jgi:hypothetical protein
MLPITEYVDIICMTYKRSNFPYIKVACVAKHVRKEFIWDVNAKHCGTDESCQSIVYSDVSDISFGGCIVGTPINIVHVMWFGVERIPVNLWNKNTHQIGRYKISSYETKSPAKNLQISSCSIHVATLTCMQLQGTILCV